MLRGKLREIEDAKRRYQLALRRLTDDPASPTQRRDALDSGREYLSLERQFASQNDQGNVTLFDEVALSNDIAAACAAAGATLPSSLARFARETDSNVSERTGKGSGELIGKKDSLEGERTQEPTEELSSAAEDIAARLKTLEALKDSGVISQDEFALRRLEILREV